MFYNGGQAGQRGLLDISGWEHMSVTEAAQAVQVSAYPDAYAKWEPLATRIVRRAGHAVTSCASSGGWVFPLGDAPYVLSAGFGECGAHWSSCHTGQDLAAPMGTPVLAAGDGTVTFAGWDGAYGNAVHVLHGNGISTWYAHLSRIHITLPRRVAAGEVIGRVGSTGNSTGPHLHLEVRQLATSHSKGTPIDPLAWLRKHRAL
jgi:murein DD-endopeptidase MepM/ murein hydrolase activator NlpD